MPAPTESDSRAVYCGAISQGDLREEIHATVDGLYCRPQRRSFEQVSPWTRVERWRDVADPTLLATEADLVGVLVRVPDVVRVGLLGAWRKVLALREAARPEVVLGPSDYTVVEMPGASL